MIRLAQRSRFILHNLLWAGAALLLIGVGNAAADSVPPSGPIVSIETTKSVGEAAGSVTIKVTLSEYCTETVTVQYGTSGYSASAGTDFTATSGTLYFLPGSVPADLVQTITVPILNDDLVNGNRIFYIPLSNPVNASLNYCGDNYTCTVTIIDDDVAHPTMQFSSATYTVTEGTNSTPGTYTEAVITVTLSAAAASNVTVNYDFATGGTATANVDYVQNAGSVTIPAGETSATYIVQIVPDHKREANETVNLILTDPTTGTTVSTATLTIIDDDSPPINVAVKPFDGKFSPDPAPINTWVDATLSARATRPLSTTISSPTWTWQFTSVQYREASHGPWNNYTGSGFDSMIISGPTSSSVGAFDYSAITISAIFPKGAYWRVRYKAKVTYTDATGPYLGSTLLNGKGTEFDVKGILIKPDGAPLYDPIKAGSPHSKPAGNQDSLPGELIDLKVDVRPEGAVGLKYEWTLPGKFFNIYWTDFPYFGLVDKIHLGGSDIDQKVDLKKQTVQYCWSDAMDARVVKCKVTSVGGSLDGTGTLNVKKPNFDPAFAANQGAVDIKVIGKVDKKEALLLYPGKGMIDGMEFGAAVKVPNPFPPGRWQFIQTVVPARFQTIAKGGVKEHWSKNKETVLDLSVPYQPSYNEYPPMDPEKVAKEPFYTGKSGYALDSPIVFLSPTVLRYSIEKDQFKTYVMFKPDGKSSQWVPLQYWGWWWQGTATLTKGVWVLSNNDQGKDKAATPTADHPQWRARVQDGKMVPD